MKWTRGLASLVAILVAVVFVSAQNESCKEELESLRNTVDKLFGIIGKQNQEIQELKSSIQGINNRDLQTLGAKVNQQHSSLAQGEVSYFKNCEEIRLNDNSKQSGTYWIDPDGHGIGDAAIQVFCNMTTGTTFVSHNRQNLTDVGHCKEPGCFSQAIKYHVSLQQIAALIEQSSNCQQLIEYQCFNAPLAFNGIQYSWWEDRHGRKHYFWSGDSDSEHKCKCQEDNDCYDPSLTCNCDSLAPLQLNDTGLINNKTVLPVTRVHFGRTFSPMSSGQYRLGKLECRGLARLGRIPESCDDLKKIGHSLSGFYTVQKSGKIATVYCDMAKLSEASGRAIPTSVYFYVQRSEFDWFGDTGRSIPFDLEFLNVGQSINITSGDFTAPIGGIYYFNFMFQGTNYDVVLERNGNKVWQCSGTNRNYDQSTVPAILDLNAGDRIQLVLQSGSVGNSQFVGMLLDPHDPYLTS